MSLEKSLSKLKSIEERFLSADEKTGNPSIDSDISDVESEEIESFIAIAQGSAMNCFLAIDMLLKHGTSAQLDGLFGEGSHKLLGQTKECLEDIAEMFDLDDEETQEEPESETEEEPVEEPEAKEPEEKEEESKEEPKSEAEKAEAGQELIPTGYTHV